MLFFVCECPKIVNTYCHLHVFNTFVRQWAYVFGQTNLSKQCTEEQSDQYLQCLPFLLQYLKLAVQEKKFRINTAFLGV